MNAIPKVVAVTGASQGIGAELVLAFLGRGYRVVANSRSIRPEDYLRGARGGGGIAEPAVADRVVSGAVEKFGRVDTLVNNAGIFIGKRKLVLTRSASTITTGTAVLYGLAAAR